jgi:hypothetical protein
MAGHLADIADLDPVILRPVQDGDRVAPMVEGKARGVFLVPQPSLWTGSASDSS